jgi:hypothetical protein
MSKTKRIRLYDHEATSLGIDLKDHDEGRNAARYTLDQKQLLRLTDLRDNKLDSVSETSPNDYQSKGKFYLSALDKENGKILTIYEFCDKYNLSKKDISSYKFLPYHYAEPSYNIVFKEQIVESVVEDIDFESIIKKHIKRIDVQLKVIDSNFDFDALTYTDVHIAMDPDKDNNSMYAEDWNRKTILETAREIVKKTLEYKNSNLLIVDDLGDLLDGLHARTTRGGHDLPQNMTNEEAFDCALEFKSIILDGLVSEYENIQFNNICNDNHSGVFAYFLNTAFKQIAELKYSNIKVTNHRTFLSHYYVKDIAFIITHGKDDKTLKFGFKPALDTKSIEKIDQYCKHNGIYKKAKRIIFKKGDSHQAVLDMAGSDDFDYFNYPAASPSSQWVQNNFKKGRRGFFIDSFKGTTSTTTPIFI